jgi:YggT family protein
VILLIHALRFLQLVIIVRIFLSWVPLFPRNRYYRLFLEKTDTLLKPFRVVIPLGGAFMDLGPLFALLILQLMERLVIHLAVIL